MLKTSNHQLLRVHSYFGVISSFCHITNDRLLSMVTFCNSPYKNLLIFLFGADTKLSKF